MKAECYSIEAGNVRHEHEFAVWEERTKWNDAALCDAYEKGLNTGLVVTIYNSPTFPQSLQEWKDQARRLDGQWRHLTERR